MEDTKEHSLNNPSSLLGLLLVVALITMGIIFISQQSIGGNHIPSEANTRYVPPVQNPPGVTSSSYEE